MKRFDNRLSQVTLLPTAEQVGLLNDAHAKLQAARSAVAEAQRVHHGITGTYLRNSDIRTHTPRVPIPEALAVNRGVIQLAIVRSWLSAGLQDGRGREVDEININRMYYPLIKWEDDTPYLNIGCIGWIRLAEYPHDGIDTQEMAACLHYPAGEMGEWCVTFYGLSPSMNGTGAEADYVAEPPAPDDDAVEECFAVKMLVSAAEVLLKTDELTDDQRTALELTLEAFA